MKIYGNTVGTTLPKPNLDQTDPNKGDFIFGDRDKFRGPQGEPGPAGLAGKDGPTVDEVLEAMPKLTGLDLSDFENGSFAEIIDGLAYHHAVSFDAEGRPVKIDGIDITWGAG